MPYRAGAHAGTTGPFVILDFPEPTDPLVVYVETLAGDIYLEERSDVERYTLAFDRLRAASLHPDDSVQLIEKDSDRPKLRVSHETWRVFIDGLRA